MPWTGRIVADPAILAGKPVVRGTRLSVELILELLAAGESEQSILEDYPGLTREDILGCLAASSGVTPKPGFSPLPTLVRAFSR
jgi:uncharacterized protein (DUF433 family)